ncbi:hypothetical protein CC80DRAFT_553326 [Byssothecium circinans]|uniref:Uncharacterized protein n=1 Tax=Byssothecium circinans TaxID=147558 RepID=A0A6A5TF39_9PLEO|nr:hypothetical protein CC80DRAFT_553326 [Byssothecium circinans]
MATRKSPFPADKDNEANHHSDNNTASYGDTDDDEESFGDHSPLSAIFPTPSTPDEQDLYWKDWVLAVIRNNDNSDSLLIDISETLRTLIENDPFTGTEDELQSGEEGESEQRGKKNRWSVGRKSFMNPTNASLQKKRGKADGAGMLRRTSSALTKGHGGKGERRIVVVRHRPSMAGKEWTGKPPPTTRMPSYTGMEGQPEGTFGKYGKRPSNPRQRPAAENLAPLKATPQSKPIPAPEESKQEQLKDIFPMMRPSQEKKLSSTFQAGSEAQTVIADQEFTGQAAEAEDDTSQLETVTQENQACEGALYKTKRVIEKLNKDFAVLKNATEKVTLLSEIAELEYKTEIEAQRAKNEAMQKEVDQQKALYEECIESLQKDIEIETLEKETLSDELEEFRNPASTSDDKIRELEEQLKQRASRIAELEAELAVANTQYKLRERASDAQTQFDARISELEAQLSATQNEPNLLQKEKDLRETLYNQYAKLQKEHEKLQDKKKKAEKAIKMHKKVSQASQDAANDATKRYTEAIDDLQSDLDDILYALGTEDDDISTYETLLQGDEEDWLPHRISSLRDKICEVIKRLLSSHEDLVELYEDLRASHDELVASYNKLDASHKELVESHEEHVHSQAELVAMHNREIATLKSSLHMRSEILQYAAGLNPEDEQRWLPLLDEGSSKFAKLKAENDRMKAKLEELINGWPEMMRANEKLKTKLLKMDERVEELQGEVMKSEQLQAEYKAAAERSEASRDGYKADLNAQIAEMQATIKEYHDRMPENDADWWKVEMLRKKVVKMEEHSKNLEERLEKMKKEREDVYGQIEVLIDEKKNLKEENEELKLSVPSPSGAGKSEKTVPFEPLSDAEVRALFYLTPEEVKKRRIEIAYFEREQDDARYAQNKAFQVMERVREWKLGYHYPPKRREWAAEMQKTTWDRWDGEAWRETVATAEDLKLLRESGIVAYNTGSDAGSF